MCAVITGRNGGLLGKAPLRAYFVLCREDTSGHPVKAWTRTGRYGAEAGTAELRAVATEYVRRESAGSVPIPLNLTQKCLRQGTGIGKGILERLQADSVDSLLNKVAERIATADDLKKFQKNLAGRISWVVCGGREPGVHGLPLLCDMGCSCWVRIFLTMLKNPGTDDVEAVFIPSM